jgi:hypothetical protein
MVRQRFTPEKIIAKLREVDVLVGRGSTVVEACRHIGIAEQVASAQHPGLSPADAADRDDASLAAR